MAVELLVVDIKQKEASARLFSVRLTIYGLKYSPKPKESSKANGN